MGQTSSPPPTAGSSEIEQRSLLLSINYLSCLQTVWTPRAYLGSLPEFALVLGPHGEKPLCVSPPPIVYNAWRPEKYQGQQP